MLSTQADSVREMAEMEILAPTNLLGRFAQIAVSICALAYSQHKEEGGAAQSFAQKAASAAQLDESLRSSAVLSLCKLMCVGREFCSKNLQVRLRPSPRRPILPPTGRFPPVMCFGPLLAPIGAAIEPL